MKQLLYQQIFGVWGTRIYMFVGLVIIIALFFIEWRRRRKKKKKEVKEEPKHIPYVVPKEAEKREGNYLRVTVKRKEK